MRDEGGTMSCFRVKGGFKLIFTIVEGDKMNFFLIQEEGEVHFVDVSKPSLTWPEQMA